MRLNEDQLQELLKRREQWERDGKVRPRPPHRIQDEPDVAPPPRPVVRPPNPRTSAGTPPASVVARLAQRERPRVRSALEIQFEQQITLAKLPAPMVDQPFLIGRKHRLDFAWHDKKIGVEVQGMVHRIKGRFKADIEKRALALLQGWRVLEVDGDSIRSGRAINWLEELLA